MTKYECHGDVRGSCGVQHRTLEAAERHCEADRRACARLSGGAYSDRYVRLVEARDEADCPECAAKGRAACVERNEDREVYQCCECGHWWEGWNAWSAAD